MCPCASLSQRATPSKLSISRSILLVPDPWLLQAAVTVARRVAQELDCPVGQEVGYAVRFEERRSPDTKITYLTGTWPSLMCAGNSTTCSCFMQSTSSYQAGPTLRRSRCWLCSTCSQQADPGGAEKRRLCGVVCRWHAAAGVPGGSGAAQVLGGDLGRSPRAQPEHRHPVRHP